jgi:hypothetical protein
VPSVADLRPLCERNPTLDELPARPTDAASRDPATVLGRIRVQRFIV